MHKEFLVQGAFDTIRNRINEIIKDGETQAEKHLLILKENNPMVLLNRGYALVTDAKGKTVSSSKKIKKNEEYSLIFSDGEAKVEGKG